MKKPNMILRYIAAGSAVIIALFLSEKIHVVTSDSVDPRIYWKTSRAAVNGDYIIFKIKDPMISDNPVAMTKRIACSVGQEISYKDRNVYCDGHFLGYAHEKNHNDQDLPLFFAPGLVPENKVLLFGDHPDSYDSRYWGFFDLNSPHVVIHPIF